MTEVEDQSRKEIGKRNSASGGGAGEDDDGRNQEVSNSRNDPLFLPNSDHPGMLLTGTKFDGSTGFAAWKRSMVIALSARNKVGFVDGTARKERFPETRQLEWKRCDNMVISWLLTALEREVAESVAFNNSAEAIWEELTSRFEENNVARLYALEQELAIVKQREDSIRSYYTKVKRIWDEIDSTDTLPSCACSTNDEFKLYIRRQRAIKFLMSVNPRFAQVRANVLMMSPLPSVQQIYSLLVQEERQKGIATEGKIEENPVSFAVDFRGKNLTYNKAQTKNPRRNNLQCTHCHKMGHTEEKCFERIGYPPNWRFPKAKRTPSTAAALDSRGMSEEEPSKPNLTEVNSGARLYSVEEINKILEHVARNKEEGTERTTRSNTSCSFVGF